MQGFRATPPENTIGPVVEILLNIDIERLTTERCNAKAISWGRLPRAMRDVASASANTVHILLILRPSAPPRAKLTELFDRDLETRGHKLQEFAGACCATVIHFELRTFPLKSNEIALVS